VYALQVVQKGIGHSPDEVTAALSSLDKKKVSDMKDTLKQFQIFLANFEVISFIFFFFKKKKLFALVFSLSLSLSLRLTERSMGLFYELNTSLIMSLWFLRCEN
jgi:hypothetical protein